RDVVEVGCGVGIGCEFLAARGARTVCGIDRDEVVLDRARGDHDSSGIEFLLWSDSLPLDYASVDVLLVPEGEAWLDEASFLEEARRVLRPEGRLLLAVPNGDRAAPAGGVGYYDLCQRLEPMFTPVRIVGQTPVLGYGLVEYQDGEPELALDTSLCENSV